MPSVVRVFFPERDRAFSYYNDRLTCTTAIWSTSAASLPGNGAVAAVDYNFRIRLADYERVIGVADTVVRGTFYMSGRAYAHAGSRRAAVPTGTRLVFPPEADGEFVTGHGPGPEYALDAAAQTHDSSEKLPKKGSVLC